MNKKTFFSSIAALSLLVIAVPSFANNLTIGTPSFGNLGSSTLDLSFSVSQCNTYNTYTTVCSTDPARDCAWIFVKYSVTGEPGPWKHCTITSVNAGDDIAATILSVADKKGVFLFPNVNRSQWTTNNVQIRWDFSADGLVSLPSEVRFRVMGIEMVYISTGPFTYNRGGGGGSSYNNYGAGSQVIVDSIDDVPTGCDTSWPNGYRSFYCAKYEVSQGQYADFLNTDDPQGTGTSYFGGKGNVVLDNSRPIGSRYYVSNGKENYTTPNFSWNDCCAYASWAGLRPLTEMEFERAGRGCNNANAYPWGNDDPNTSNPNDIAVDASMTANLYFANYYQYNTTRGPMPVGHYQSGLTISGTPVSPARTVARTGASPYGIADLGGNEHEYLMNCSHTITPLNGNGTTTAPASWPAAATNAVGYRGSSYTGLSNESQVSNRGSIYFSYSNGRYGYTGFRPARTP